MSTSAHPPLGLASITVTYNPQLDLLERQLEALPPDIPKIVVDNASSNVEELAALLVRLPHVKLLRLPTNVGLAAGLNRGLEAAARLEPQLPLVLLLDQDSVPLPGSVQTLVETFHELEAAGEKVGCVGPALLDPSTGLSHGFHRIVGWRWKRAYPSREAAPMVCSNLNGSGTTGRLSLFRKLGGLDESLFIDHVDTEWAFRVQQAGYGLWGVPGALFEHSMGMGSLPYWFFGWRIWPVRSPGRHEMLFRNALRLMFRSYVPFTWKVWGLVKLVMTLAVTMYRGPQRADQLRSMVSGVISGARTYEKR